MGFWSDQRVVVTGGTGFLGRRLTAALHTRGYRELQPTLVGREILIRDLLHTTADAVGYTGAIAWDASKPNRQPRPQLGVLKAERCFGFRATTSFDDGLRQMVEWYRSQRASQLLST